MNEGSGHTKPIEQTLILGVGNLLLADEGVGIRVIERLQEKYEIPEEVHVLDGGTLGMDLLYYLDGVKRLLLIDAVETGEAPGYMIRLEGEAVPAFLSIKISPHQIGVPDMLFAAKLRDLYPQEIVLWGVQPEILDIGLELSETVAALLETLVENIRQELDRWGIALKER